MQGWEFALLISVLLALVALCVKSDESETLSWLHVCKEQQSKSLLSLFLKKQREQMSSFTKIEKSHEEQFTLLFCLKKRE